MIAWMAGHTHRPRRVIRDGIYEGVNPWGYPRETGVSRNREAVFREGMTEEDLVELEIASTAVVSPVPSVSSDGGDLYFV